MLVVNHEIGGGEDHRVPAVEGFVYDPVAGGGTTTIEVDKDGNRVREYVSLAGTHNNCAGGRSPWGTWMTCEEAESLTGQTKKHGYVFEVDPYDQELNRDPQPIKALGRYAHEALVVDPDTGVIYLTEDAGNPNGLLYRWTPPDAALPLGRGVLRRLHARRPGQRLGRPGQHHGFGLRRADPRRGRRGQAAPGRLDRERRGVLLRPQRDRGRLGVHRADVLERQEDPVREHPGARLRVRDQRPLHAPALILRH